MESVISEREVHQARLLLLEIGTYLNMENPATPNPPTQWIIAREEAIRDERWFNETLDKIEDLSREIYGKLEQYMPQQSSLLASSSTGTTATVPVPTSVLDFLMGKTAYIHNLVRKVETVGECTGTMIRGPKI
jgi:hypothetical protein